VADYAGGKSEQIKECMIPYKRVLQCNEEDEGGGDDKDSFPQSLTGSTSLLTHL